MALLKELKAASDSVTIPISHPLNATLATTPNIVEETFFLFNATKIVNARSMQVIYGKKSSMAVSNNAYIKYQKVAR